RGPWKRCTVDQERFLEAFERQAIGKRSREIDAAAEQDQLTMIRESLTRVLELLRQREHEEPQDARAQQDLRFVERACFRELHAIAAIAQRRVHRETQTALLDLT